MSPTKGSPREGRVVYVLRLFTMSVKIPTIHHDRRWKWRRGLPASAVQLGIGWLSKKEGHGALCGRWHRDKVETHIASKDLSAAAAAHKAGRPVFFSKRMQAAPGMRGQLEDIPPTVSYRSVGRVLCAGVPESQLARGWGRVWQVSVWGIKVGSAT
jgi:hypothetical protein